VDQRTDQLRAGPLAAIPWYSAEKYQLDRTMKNIVQRLDSQPNVSTVAAFAQDEMSFFEKRLNRKRWEAESIAMRSLERRRVQVGRWFINPAEICLANVDRPRFPQPTWNDLSCNHGSLPRANRARA